MVRNPVRAARAAARNSHTFLRTLDARAAADQAAAAMLNADAGHQASGEIVDFVVLHTDSVFYGDRLGLPLAEAIGWTMPSAGMTSREIGRLRCWWFTTPNLYPNPLAEHVLTRWGSHQPGGWRGPVTLTMNTAERMPPSVLDTLCELVAMGLIGAVR